jgi:hypothetical protein
VKQQLSLSDQNTSPNTGKTYWMSFDDYLRNFYLTSICLYRDNYSAVCITDLHEIDEHGVCQLILKENIDAPIVFTLH